MESLEPIINVLLLLTALSIAAERLANLIKLSGGKTLRVQDANKDLEKERERKIALRVLGVGIGLAIVMKANAFTILTNLHDPWSTIGWFRLEGPLMIPTSEVVNVWSVFYILLGCTIVGAALGFGSKFWHDVLDIVLELRNRAKGDKSGR